MLEFGLSAGCTLRICQGDITRIAVDAIVNAANPRLLGGGGVDGAIHRAAGSQLLDACRAIPELTPGVRCPTGAARLTSAFKLPCKYVIHTVGPVFADRETSQPLLEAAYQSSLWLANEQQAKSIAFPAISCGIYGYPHDQAALVAYKQCQRHAGILGEIYFVLFDEQSYDIWTGTIGDLVQKTRNR